MTIIMLLTLNETKGDEKFLFKCDLGMKRIKYVFALNILYEMLS